MKTLFNVFVLVIMLNCLGLQLVFSANKIQFYEYKQTHSLNHDLLLVKPLVNFNDTDGGFYSEYYIDQFNNVYCGAIVQNIGTLSATHVYL